MKQKYIIIETYKDYVIRYMLSERKSGGKTTYVGNNISVIGVFNIENLYNNILFETSFNMKKDMIHGKIKAIQQCKDFIDNLVKVEL